MVITELSDGYKETHQQIDVDNLIIKLKYLMIEKKNLVKSGNIWFMVVLKKETDGGNKVRKVK